MQDLEFYKEKLEKELKILENQIFSIAEKNPNVENDWMPKSNISINEVDPNKISDQIEDLGTNSAILVDLETRMANVKLALEKIKNNTFGICENCNTQISDKRLDANPAARQCMNCVNS
jgi:DnaK suppressor protein